MNRKQFFWILAAPFLFFASMFLILNSPSNLDLIMGSVTVLVIFFSWSLNAPKFKSNSIKRTKK